MNINYSFRGLDHSDGMQDYATKKISKFEKLVDATSVVDVVFVKDKNEKKTEIKCLYKGEEFFASEASDEFNASIDLCVDKVVKQLIKAKERKVDSRKGSFPL